MKNLIVNKLKMNENSLELNDILYKQYKTSVYYVNSLGDCIRLQPRMVMLKAVKNKSGYLKYYMKVDGKYEQNYIHRLVYELFCSEIVNGEINHKNSDKADNRLENLECVSHKKNMEHYFDTIKGKTRTRKKAAFYKSIETVVINMMTGDRRICSNRSAASRSIGKKDVYITSLLSRGMNFDRENLYIDKDQYIEKGYETMGPIEIVRKMIGDINFV